jgi:hypothetical protein
MDNKQAPHNPLLSLFKGELDFSEIEGDLLEEFNQKLVEAGPEQAKEFYWQESFRNVWALTTRPRNVHLLGSTALCVAIFRLVTPTVFHWLRFELSTSPRVTGLGFLLITLFEIAAMLLMGGALTRVWKDHARLVRLTFTCLYLLTVARFVLFSGIAGVWLSEPLRFVMDQVGLLLVVTSFWVGSRVVESFTRPTTHQLETLRR